MWEGFFQCAELVEFVIAHASPVAEREPSAALFRDPPLEARPGAFWSWLNWNVDLDQITRELREMKAKGMSGAAAMCEAVHAALAEFALVAADCGVPQPDIDRFSPDIARRLRP